LIEASQQGRVLHLALNRPEKRNALNSSLCQALVEAFAQAGHDPSIGAIVLSGNGPSFCAGMDLKEALESEDDPFAELHERLFSILERTRKPILAAVHGTLAGGGVGLAANAHIVIAAPDTKFGLTEIKIALWPVLIFPSVALAIGERKATELALTGRLFDAREAQQFGLVAEIAENPLARAQALANEIAAYSPNALAKGLDYSRRIRRLTQEERAAAGRQTRADLMSHPDFAKSVKQFFAKSSA
jgi:enoyl-CoA hydratase/carnithine racemase